MSDLTPQQMRELADQHEERAQWTAEGESGRKWFRDTAAALRTAADQLEASELKLRRLHDQTVRQGEHITQYHQRLEAVRSLVTGWPAGATFTASAILYALNTDITPQEDR